MCDHDIKINFGLYSFIVHQFYFYICYKHEIGEPDDGSHRKQSKEQSSLYDAKLNSYRGDLKHDKRETQHKEQSQSDSKGEVSLQIKK